MIAGYAGASDKLDQALAKFARAYADQTEADHAALVKATRRGLLPWPTVRCSEPAHRFVRDVGICAWSPGAARPPEHT